MREEEWREKKMDKMCRGRKRASWIMEQTRERRYFGDYEKRGSWTGHVMRRGDDRWTTLRTEWQPRNCRSQGRQRTRWRDEIRAFAGAGWSITSDLERWRMLGEVFVNALD